MSPALADVGRSLAGSKELHRPDDVELLAAGAAALRRVDAEVDDGVDVLDGDDLADDGGPDVRTDELDPVQIQVRQDRVDPDDLVDAGFLAEGGEASRHHGRE
jgi:hypothetical protein